MSRTRTFAALVDHDEVTLTEYQSESGGMRIVDVHADVRPFESGTEAAHALGALLSAQRASGGRVAIAVNGFGAFHHSMVLPASSPEVVRPIVERDIRRLFSVENPHIVLDVRAPGAAGLQRATPAAGASARVHAAGAPRELIDALQQALREARMRIDGITIVPRALQRVYESVDNAPEPTAVVACLDGGVHLAFLVAGDVIVALDPQMGAEPSLVFDPATVVEQFDRAAVAFRQEARGAEVGRVLLAAPPGKYDDIAEALRARYDVHVAPLARALGSAASIVGMGAVLDARGGAPLDLAIRPPSLGARVGSTMRGPWGVPIGLAAAAALAVAWGGVEYARYRADRGIIAAARAEIARELPAVEQMHQSVRDRVAVLGLRSTTEAATSERDRLAFVLGRLAAAAGPTVRLDSLGIVRKEEGWQVALHGISVAPDGPTVVRGVTGFVRQLQNIPSFSGVALDIGSYSGPPAVNSPSQAAAPHPRGVVATFSVSFVASPADEGAR